MDSHKIEDMQIDSCSDSCPVSYFNWIYHVTTSESGLCHLL